MTDTRVAYVRPTGGDRGKLVFTEDDQQDLRYMAQDLSVSEGFYRVTFKYGHSLVFLNKIVPVGQSEIGSTKQIVETLPRLSRKIKKRVMSELEGLSDSEAYEKLCDRLFLRRIKGIGKATSKIISETVGNQSEKERELLQLLGHFQIEADLAANWYRYLAAYFDQYAEGNDRYSHSFKDVRENPYLLYRIQKDYRVRDFLEEHAGVKPGRKLSFNLIDERVLASNPKWKYHKARAKEYAFKVLREARSSGHSVIDLSEVTSRMHAKDIEYIYETIDSEEAEELTPPVIRRLVSSSRMLENVRFMRADGTEDWGVCLSECKRWHDTSVKGLKTLIQKEPLLSEKETKQQLYEAVHFSEDFELTEGQRNALENAFGSRVSAITGGAGTGKTTVAQRFLKGSLLARTARSYTNPITQEEITRSGHHIYVLAPTGVAAQRIRNGLNLTDDIRLRDGLRKREYVKPQKISHSEHGVGFKEGRKRHIKQGKVFLGTLHSFLGYRGGSTYLLPAAHPCIIFIDEMSMVDEELFYQLMRFVEKCDAAGIDIQVLFTGDHYQLPPVGVGFPFRDIMGSSYGAAIPVTELKEVKRQGESSMTVHASNEIKALRLPPSPANYAEWGIDYDKVDFAWHEPGDMPPQMATTSVLSNYAGYLSGRTGSHVSMRDIQVVIPLKNQSKIEPDAEHTRRLNGTLQRHYAQEAGLELKEYEAKKDEDSRSYDVTFALHDKVIHTGDNGYSFGGSEPINRGSMGRIVSLTEDEIEVAYPWLDKAITYRGATGFGSLELAYAITGHAAQGSEYDYVLQMLPDRAAINPRTGESIVDRSWLYTAVTRAKRHIMLIASKARLTHAISHSTGLSRNTLLARELVRI